MRIANVDKHSKPGSEATPSTEQDKPQAAVPQSSLDKERRHSTAEEGRLGQASPIADCSGKKWDE
ncbi:hypothetical protein ColTof4_11536 [Colletotrichum tofieldiae]|nr:hypothetical protein ColTof3_04730 [Colletotrichum tofieldiae]GKT79113.1 hypothetical protein ColTof4_11536 [Colletotrichum tofieldiae]